MSCRARVAATPSGRTSSPRAPPAAGGARGDDVLPDGVAATRARHDMAEAEECTRRAPVAREERPPRDLPLQRPRHAHVRDEPDHMRPRKRARRRAEWLLE